MTQGDPALILGKRKRALDAPLRPIERPNPSKDTGEENQRGQNIVWKFCGSVQKYDATCRNN